MIDSLRYLIQLQDIDSRIVEKRIFIDRVPGRVSEVDSPFNEATDELMMISGKKDVLAKKKSEKETRLEEISDKIQKMKSRVSDIKTNKEYQAHLKEIESLEKKISDIEEEILIIMEELDTVEKKHDEQREKLAAEKDKINAFKKELAAEVEMHETELKGLMEERNRLVDHLDRELYNRYMSILDVRNGIAICAAQNEICSGCNMHVPPQLFVEIKKNEEILQCPQCRRILFFAEQSQT